MPTAPLPVMRWSHSLKETTHMDIVIAGVAVAVTAAGVTIVCSLLIVGLLTGE